MLAKRAADQQVAFRIEAKLAEEWNRFVGGSLIPSRAHHACAMLLYIWEAQSPREAVHRAYAQFLQQGSLECNLPPAGELASITADEQELLLAYRNACEEAKDEAIANLLDRPESSSHSSDTGETRNHRVG